MKVAIVRSMLGTITTMWLGDEVVSAWYSSTGELCALGYGWAMTVGIEQ